MILRKTLFSSIIICAFSLISLAQNPEGHWLGSLELNDTAALPFEFKVMHVNDQLVAAFINGQDTTWSLRAIQNKDTLFFEHSVFETQIALWKQGDKWVGFHEYLGRSPRYTIPLTLTPYQERLFNCQPSDLNVSGLWNVHFLRDAGRLSPATGSFIQEGQMVRGSFLTETGDYRYLNGCVSGNQLKLSGYDGLFVYLFHSTIIGDSVFGTFFSGSRSQTTFYGIRAERSFLRDPYSITRMKTVDQYFPKPVIAQNLKEISISEALGGKGPAIIQLMGTWCPNCMDESRYLKTLMQQYGDSGLKVIGVSFERSAIPEEAWKRIGKMQSSLQIPYPLYFGGPVQADTVLAIFPFMEQMRSYPTTIYLNKQLEPVKILTGFSGPGTGTFFETYKEETESFIVELLNQDL